MEVLVILKLNSISGSLGNLRGLSAIDIFSLSALFIFIYLAVFNLCGRSGRVNNAKMMHKFLGIFFKRNISY